MMASSSQQPGQAALQHVGHPQPVVALSACPVKCISVVSHVLQDFLSGTYSSASRKKFDPVCQPLAFHVQQEPLQAIWNTYIQNRRHRHQ